MRKKFIQSLKERGVLRTTQIALDKANPWSARSVKARKRNEILRSLQADVQADGCIVKRIHGSLMRLDVSPGTRHTLETDLAVEGTRESASTEFFADRLVSLKRDWAAAGRSAPLIIDIGANVGYFVLLEASIFGGDATVLAIEPEIENCDRLRHNIDLNNYANVCVIRAAVSNASGRAKLYVGNQSNIHKLNLEGKDPNFAEVQEVELRSVDELVSQYAQDASPVIIRMDVEGHEWQAIQGMSDTFRSDRPIYLFFELHPTALKWAPLMAATLHQAGFEVERIDNSKGLAKGSDTVDVDALAAMATDAHIFARRGC
jgi:FkbM family methyltransferase